LNSSHAQYGHGNSDARELKGAHIANIKPAVSKAGDDAAGNLVGFIERIEQELHDICQQHSTGRINNIAANTEQKNPPVRHQVTQQPQV
jgi:hypothetical protein